MPALLREGGFEVRIYTLDHPPPHVHVAKAGAVMKIELAGCQVIEIVGAISDRDVEAGRSARGRECRFSEEGMDEDPWQAKR